MNWKKYVARAILALVWIAGFAEAWHFREVVVVALEALLVVGVLAVAWFGGRLLADWVMENL